MNIKNINFSAGIFLVFIFLITGCSQNSDSSAGKQNTGSIYKDPYLVTEYQQDILGDSYLAQGVINTADGGWVAVGHTGRVLTVWKFSTDGILDTSFSGDGILRADEISSVAWDSADSLAKDITNSTDSGWLVVGSSSVPGYHLMLMKVTVTGALDTNFNNGNILGIDIGSENKGEGIARTSDSAWIAVGSTKADQIDPERMMAVKFTDSGSIDTSFAAQGIYIDNMSGGVAHGVTSTSDGGWVIAGESLVSGSSYYRATLWKFTDQGELDTKFYGDGVAVSGIDIDEGSENYQSSAWSITNTSDGGWVVTGSIGQKPRMAVWKFTAKNELQTSVFNNGVFIDTPEFVYLQTGGESISATNDGGWVVAGFNADLYPDMAIWKFTAIGVLDSALAGDGFFTQNYASGGGERDIARAVTKTNDGGWVAVGAADIGPSLVAGLRMWKFNQ